MSAHRLNPRLVKIHRTYTVEEIARLVSVHKNTVRTWIKEGLEVCDDIRPFLVHGYVLRTFLEKRRNRNKRPCGLGEMYCLKCRMPQKPAGNMAEYQPKTDVLGNLVAICPDCLTLMNRRTSIGRMLQIRRIIDITLPQALQHIVENDVPIVNSDLKKGVLP